MMRKFGSLYFFTQILISCFCFENWPWTSENESLKTVYEGQNVTLKCAGRHENVSTIWEYKPCGDDFNLILCSQAVNDEYRGWSTLQTVENHDEPLTGYLHLKNVTVSDQGLYRCSQRASANIKLRSAVRLRVLSKDISDTDLGLPVFLDGLPKNLSVLVDSQAVFQCKVLSRTPPLIFWVVARAPEAGSLQYHQHWYSIMSAPAPIGLLGREYVSKMVLPRVKVTDTGIYYCVATNTKGFANSSSYLEVIGDNGEWTFYLLFLVPLGLAAVPAILWACFMWRRKGKTEDESADSSLRDSLQEVTL